MKFVPTSSTVATAAVALLVPLLVVAAPGAGSATPTPSPTATATPSPTATPKPTSTPKPTQSPKPTPTQSPKPKGWKPSTGVRFNEPRQAKRSHAINRYMRKGINGTPRGGKIRIVTWNFNNPLFRNDLIRAHKRGVSVRVIMANGLATSQGAQGDYPTLLRELGKGNKKRKPEMTSWIRTCKNSCRGKEGIQHGKWLMFSKTGQGRRVVMSTSANLTQAAAFAQWNDILTVVDRRKTWRQYNKIFDQMALDRQVRPAFYTFKDEQFHGWFFPQMGKVKRHNVLRLLNGVKCKGARGSAGQNGRTVIRVSQAVFNGRPGTAIANKLAQLHRRGCKVKLVYGVLNNNARDKMKSIPKRMYLEDTNDDGYIDRYLHMKVMTISGWHGKKRRAHIAYQGSANWSGMATLSDEQGFIIHNKRLERRYSNYIERLFRNPPPQGVWLTKPPDFTVRKAVQDPFALIREEMGMGDMEPAL